MMLWALNTQAVCPQIHLPLINDVSEKGITKTAESISLTVKMAIETFVGVWNCDFWQKTMHVSKFPKNARSIKKTRKVAPITISVAVKTKAESVWSSVKFLLVFMVFMILETEISSLLKVRVRESSTHTWTWNACLGVKHFVLVGN